MQSFPEQYNSLNSAQKQAVDYMDGPLLITAGPGTGKTQLLSIRTANIIRSKKADPSGILILTFSNAAAKAMRDRLARVIGSDGYYVEVETFHSFANSIVLDSEEALKFVNEKVEISDVEKIRALEYILDNVKGAEALRPFGAPYVHRREIEKRISELKNEGVMPEEMRSLVGSLKADDTEIEGKHIPRLKALSVIYENYERLKSEEPALLFDDRGRIDYDDMILVALRAISGDAALADRLRKQYEYIMVDEFQDTNGAQLELLLDIVDPDRKNICCVGDDDQAIYRFQGATLANFRIFSERYPTLRVVELKTNYRSSGEIVTHNGGIISRLPENERFSSKELFSSGKVSTGEIKFVQFDAQEEELLFLTKRIKDLAKEIEEDGDMGANERKTPYNNIAVLVRKRNQILPLVDAFLREGIPYATDGMEDMRSEKRVRQLRDVLEMASIDPGMANNKSLSLYRVLSSDYINAEQADILAIMNYFNRKRKKEEEKKGVRIESDFFTGFLRCFPVDMSRIPSEKMSKELEISSRLALKDPHILHRASWAVHRLICDRDTRPVHDILMQYIEDVNLYRFLLDKYEKEKLLRIRDLRALVSFINMIKSSDLARPGLRADDFIRELELREVHGMAVMGEVATAGQDGVRLLTAHSAKGLEFHTVFMPFCLERESWPLRRKGDSVPLPADIIRSKEKAGDKKKMNMLNLYDELRLFYVASTRARKNIYYTAFPREKAVASRFIDNLKPVRDVRPSGGEEEVLRAFLRNVKDSDGFHGCEDILRDMVRDLSLNPTSLNNYINCRRKFLYDNVLRLPGKKNQHLTFGNCCHKALEKVYDVFGHTGKFPSFGFFKKLFLRELEYQGVSQQIKNWCRDRLNTLEDWYRDESVAPVKPLELEKKLEITIGDGVVFRGTFDKIEEGSNGGVIVVDYKTGKPDKHVKAITNCGDLSSPDCDDYFRQLVAYKLLYDRSKRTGDGRLDTGVLQFLEPVGESVKKYDLEKGRYIKKIMDLSDSDVKTLENIILKCWNDIKDLRFEKLPERDGKKRCVNCPFDALCWEE